MMKKKAVSLLTGTSLWLLTGCLQPSPTTTHFTPTQTKENLVFHTNQADFLHQLKGDISVESRNAYLDEFLLKSDMQCANYLNQPLHKTSQKTDNMDSLYMGIADTVSTLFGVHYITETAKGVFLNNNKTESDEEKKAYENALSPEIRKGVEIGRARFAKEIATKKSLPLSQYSATHVNLDTKNYDKQCNFQYGLIEINRALKAMQSELNRQVVVQKPKKSIDPIVIKEKVTKATKEVQQKEIEKNSKPQDLDKKHKVLSI